MPHVQTALLAIVFAAIPYVVYRWRGVPGVNGRSLVWGAIAAPLAFVALAYVASVWGATAAILVSAVANVAVAVVCERNARAYHRLQHLASALERPAAAAEIAEVDALVAKWWKRGKESPETIRWTLRFAQGALVGLHTEAALRWLDAIPESVLSRPLRAVRAQYRCHLLVRQRDLAEARRVLEAAPRPAPQGFEEVLVATEALLDVLGGDATVAKRAEEELAKAAPALRLGWQAVLAHAHALRGEQDQARECLERALDESGEGGVARIAAQHGPASAIASSLLTKDGPYR